MLLLHEHLSVEDPFFSIPTPDMSLSAMFSYMIFYFGANFLESWPNLFLYMPLQFLSKVWFCVPDTNIKQPVPVTEDQECIWITSIASAGNIIPAFAKYTAERLGY